jgi:hypothetical protein
LRFDYYSSLSSRDRAIYDKSDRLTEVPLPVSDELRETVDGVREALAGEKLRGVQRAITRLSSLICSELGVTPLEVVVKSKRPIRSDGEYHGLYEREDRGSPTLTLWMRTARQKRVVTFKTFLRTFVHELCHHLDYDLFNLPDSFHTEGFFRRESNLYRKLVPKEEPAKRVKKKPAAAPKKPRPKSRPKASPAPKPPRKRKPRQTELPFGD